MLLSLLKKLFGRTAKTKRNQTGLVWSAAETEGNFKQQASHLDKCLRKNPTDDYESLQEYVSLFYYSPVAQVVAIHNLREKGYLALANQKGIDWLIKTYPTDRAPRKHELEQLRPAISLGVEGIISGLNQMHDDYK